MPSSEEHIKVRRIIARRYLSHAVESEDIPLYLGARLAGTGLTETTDQSDMSFETKTGEVTQFLAANLAKDIGPTFIVRSQDEGPASKYTVGELLLFPSLELAKGLSSWFAGLAEAGTCSDATVTLIAIYMNAVASGNINTAISAGAKLADGLSDDWQWQLIGLRYCRLIGDGPGLNAQIQVLLDLPRERSTLINELKVAFDRVRTDTAEQPGSLPSFDQEVVQSSLTRFGHLPWNPAIGLTGAIAKTVVAPADVDLLASSIDELLDRMGPAYWHQTWQAIMQVPEFRADPRISSKLTEAFAALCAPNKESAQGRRTEIYTSLMRYFFFRLDSQFRGLLPIGVLWGASKLASELERELAGFFNVGYDAAFGYFDAAADQEFQTWAVSTLDSDLSGYRDMYVNKHILWPCSLAAIPDSIPLDAITVPEAHREVFRTAIRSIGLVFATKPSPDSDAALPVADLLARSRLPDWLTALGDDALTAFVVAAEQTNARYSDNNTLLEALKNLPSHPEEECLVLLMNAISRIRARQLRVKDILEAIGTEEWIATKLPPLSETVLNSFWSMLTACPVMEQRDDTVRLAHWGAYAFKNASLKQDELKALAFTTVLISMKASAFSAISRLNSTPNDLTHYDAQGDIESVLNSLESQAPLWIRGRVRAARVALLPTGV